jgi:maltooligosyltrehalose trehalohydrolase
VSGGEAWRPSLGAIAHDSGTAFRAWAPKPGKVDLVVEQQGERRVVPLERDGRGYVEHFAEGVRAGARYGYLIDGQGPFPDPCSRSQPGGVHALSEVVDPSGFAWSDAGWTPPPLEELVIYECHIGTLTREGTFDAAIGALPYLRDLGVTAVEVMPVAAFPGRWNWGYDGVALFAPAAPYGGPDGFRRFVDAAHRHGLAVILDVVYNHFGPDGNYTGLYSADYVTNRHRTPWGDAINFDGPNAWGMREFCRENILHWLHDYHVDGFRFDATHAIYDDSQVHILAELSAAVEAQPRGDWRPYLIAESHENDVRYLKPRAQGGFAFDAVWADDFHQCVRVALTGEREGYFAGFDGSMAQLARTIRQGFGYEGEFDPGAGEPRGTRARRARWTSFVYCTQNHDQVGNRPFGERLHATAAKADVRAAAMLLLLLPQTPLLFQGQEYFAPQPFQYFTDHEEGLGRLVTEGRRREFAPFSAFTDLGTRERIPDPQAEATYRRSQLDLAEAAEGEAALVLAFHRELIATRRRDAVLRDYRSRRLALRTAGRGQVLTVRYTSPSGRRLLAVNFGPQAAVRLALPDPRTIALHSNEGRWGGTGRAPRVEDGRLLLPAHTAAWLTD